MRIVEKEVLLMAVSEAQKKSAQKWDAANLDRVSIAMPKGMKDTVKAAAAVAGESMNQYIIGATEQRINGLQQPAGAPQGDGAILTPAALKTAQEAAQRAGETVPAFVSRSVETQAQRDKVMQAMRTKEKAPDKSET
jgi:predicted HicB family RNase H-like nuclease